MRECFPSFWAGAWWPLERVVWPLSWSMTGVKSIRAKWGPKVSDSRTGRGRRGVRTRARAVPRSTFRCPVLIAESQDPPAVQAHPGRHAGLQVGLARCGGERRGQGTGREKVSVLLEGGGCFPPVLFDPTAVNSPRLHVAARPPPPCTPGSTSSLARTDAGSAAGRSPSGAS